MGSHGWRWGGIIVTPLQSTGEGGEDLYTGNLKNKIITIEIVFWVEYIKAKQCASI